MLPPRYLLREAAILSLLEDADPGPFLEIGCGGGELLVTLGKRGHRGVGTDLSAEARAVSRRRLAEEGVTGVSVVEEVPRDARFGVVGLFEVLGYAEDPVALLESCRDRLVPGGRLLISFVRPGAGYSPRVVKDMKSFTREEAIRLAEQANLEPRRVVNYGFPLANALVPVMNTVHGLRIALRGGTTETGLLHTELPGGLSRIVNRRTLSPFVWVQRRFSGTDLGNGYVLEATRP